MHKSSLAAAMRVMLTSYDNLIRELERRRGEYDLERSAFTDFTTDKPIHNPRNNRKTKKSSKK